MSYDDANDGGIQQCSEVDRYEQDLTAKYPCLLAWPGKKQSPVLSSGKPDPKQEPEMKISDMVPSSYLKQSDFDESGLIVTIKSLEHKNVARDDEAPEEKWIIYFNEFDRGLVLNTTNINALAKACDADDTDNWPGKEVVVYVDPNVGFGGKTTGGLRIKKYSAPAAPKVAAKPRPMVDAEPPF